MPQRKVHLDQCNGCGQCADDCPFDAITVQPRGDAARWEYEVAVTPDLCAACGICVGSCHSSNPFRLAKVRLETGIDMPQLPIDEVRSRTHSILAGLEGETRIMIYGCDHAFDVAELEAPNLGPLSFFCTGQMPPALVEYALKNGADGVFIVGCRTGDCCYRYGNVSMDKRFEGGRKPILRSRADRNRIAVCRAAVTDDKKLTREFAGFKRTLVAMKRGEPASASREAADA